MSGALEGVRVLDMTTGQQGPVAAQYMGDLGADVIKIEEPEKGDFNRGHTRAFGLSLALPGNRTVPMEAHNRNKRGLAVDLRHQEGKEVIYKLVAKSDVFMQNFRPGVAAKLGVDYETLTQYNPRLVYGSATCFGEKGPESARGGNDLMATARSGLLFQAGQPGVPAPIGDTLADRAGAILFAYGLMAALFARERLGIGQQVHASLLGAMIHLQGHDLALTLLKGTSVPNPGRARPSRPFLNLYKCKDGSWLTISHARNPELYWPLFCKALNAAELTEDPRFLTQIRREENSEELTRILDAIFATRTYQEWADIFREQIPGFIFDKAQHISELPSDPQVIENEYIVDFEHPTLGRIKTEGVAAHLTKTPGSIRLPCPELGQHTSEILLETGYSEQQIATLKEQGVVR